MRRKVKHQKRNKSNQEERQLAIAIESIERKRRRAYCAKQVEECDEQIHELTQKLKELQRG